MPGSEERYSRQRSSFASFLCEALFESSNVGLPAVRTSVLKWRIDGAAAPRALGQRGEKGWRQEVQVA